MVELSILAVATEWVSKKGGISTFNRELCVALASIGHKVCCFVPEFTPDEDNDARNQNVTLVIPKSIPGVPEEAVSYLTPQLPENFFPDTILGHDRITGPIAQHQKETWFNNTVLVNFVHTTPSEIERFKHEHSLAEAERREEVQVKLAGASNLVVAVGPLLQSYFGPELAGLETEPPPIEYINPGVNNRPDVRTRTGQTLILISGRMEDTAIKGLDLAAAAVARFNGLSAKPSVLFVRGCAEEHEKKVRELLQSHLSHDAIKIKPYTYLRERLDADMRKAALLLMPSRAEGFGLVALEAIGLGVPVLISSRSGLADVLRTVAGSIADRFIVTVSEESDLESDASEWSSRIATVMADLDSANRDVQELRLRLSTELLWSRAAEQLTQYIVTAQQRTTKAT